MREQCFVLTEPTLSSFVVAPLSKPERTLLVSSNDALSKGNIVDLSFTTKYQVQLNEIVQLREEESERIRQKFTSLHAALWQRQEGWGDPEIQSCFELSQLSLLTQQDQVVLCTLVLNSPEHLLFQRFKHLDCLTYQKYLKLCQDIERTPVPEELVRSATHTLDKLKLYYCQNIDLTPDYLALTTEAERNLLGYVGLKCKNGLLRWHYSNRVENELAELLAQGCAYQQSPLDFDMHQLCAELAQSMSSHRISVVVAGSPLDVYFSLFLSMQEQFYTLDFECAFSDAMFTTFAAVQTPLIIVKAHLASPPTLLTILRQRRDLTTVLFYEQHYENISSSLLNQYINCTLAPAGIPDIFVQWENRCWGDRICYEETTPFPLVDFNPAHSVYVAARPGDLAMLDLNFLPILSHCARQIGDPFCRTYWRVEEHFELSFDMTQYHIDEETLQTKPHIVLGQLRTSYESLYYYSSQPIQEWEIRRLLYHARKVTICCNKDHIPQ